MSAPVCLHHAMDAPPARFPAPPPPLPVPDPARWPMGGAIRLGLAALALLVLGLGGWAVFAQLAGAIHAPGRIEVESHRQTLQHPEGGIVAEVLVHEGDHVTAGQVLLRLDGTLLRNELALTEAQVFQARAHRARLEAERADRPALRFPSDLTQAASNPERAEILASQASLFTARHEAQAQMQAQLARQGSQITARLAGITARAEALTSQRALLERELTDTRTLFDKGLAQSPRLLALEREAARMDGELAELAASREEAESRAEELEILARRQTATRREEAESDLAALTARELDLAARRRDLTERIARLDLCAPVAGIVHQLTVTAPGAVLRGAEPVLAIVPQDRPLLVVARIDPADIDRAHLHQPAVLRFSTLPAPVPELTGAMTHIAPDAVADPATGTAYYRAEITIPAEELARLGAHPLIPGMPVEVFIRTGSQSPLRYLLKPLADHLARTMRED